MTQSLKLTDQPRRRERNVESNLSIWTKRTGGHNLKKAKSSGSSQKLNHESENTPIPRLSVL